MIQFAAHETRYAGHLFRSRLEATWAAFFDVVGWEWVYEPFELNGYMPDFLLKMHRDVLVEVKPSVFLEEAYRKIGASGWTGEALILTEDWTIGTSKYADGLPLLGHLGEPEWLWEQGEGPNLPELQHVRRINCECTDCLEQTGLLRAFKRHSLSVAGPPEALGRDGGLHYQFPTNRFSWHPGAAVFRCSAGGVGYGSDLMEYGCRMCGKCRTDRHGMSAAEVVRLHDYLRNAWGQAKEATRWRPR